MLLASFEADPKRFQLVLVNFDRLARLSSNARFLSLRWCFNSVPNFRARAFFLFFFLPLKFFLSPLRPISRIGILDFENFDLIHRSLRARYPSLLVFFQIDSVYISRIFQPKNRRYLGFHVLFNIYIIQS